MPDRSQSRILIKYSTKRTKEFLELSKLEMRKITGLLTGHCPLKGYLKKGKIADDNCRLCLEEEETSKHVLCVCVAVARIRLRHFGKGFLELKDLGDQTLKRSNSLMNST